MSTRRFFAILRARWLSAALALALTMSLAAGWALLRSPRYTASASVIVDVKSPDPITGMVLQGAASPSFMITQVDIIQSLRVARQVVKTLKLEDDPRLQSRWKASASAGPFEDWAAESLKRSLDVRPSRGSNVVNVSFTDDDPGFAARVANGFVQSYLSTTVDLRVAPAKEHSGFFDERSKQLREAIERAQAKLSAFQQQKGLIATDERLDGENTRLVELTQQVVALEAAAAEAKSRQGQAEATPERMQEVLNDPVVYRLAADLARQESKLEELRERLGPANPQLTEMQISVDALRTRLAAATRRASGSVTITSSVTQSRLAQALAARDSQRAKLLELKTQRNEAMALQRDVESAQRSYDGVKARLDQTGLELQTAPSNISALEYASVPVRPSSMGILRVLVLGLLAGALLACATVLLREWRDRRLRTDDELIQLVNLPLIGVVPGFAFASKPAPLQMGRRQLLRYGA